MKPSFSSKAQANLIPPSAKKRSQKSSEEAANKRRRCEFAKLDPVAHAHRIQQRRKAVEKGKNTVGYDCYRQQVPKAERLLSMDTPATPDPTLDIPAKRWLGQMKAWYVRCCLFASDYFVRYSIYCIFSNMFIFISGALLCTSTTLLILSSLRQNQRRRLKRHRRLPPLPKSSKFRNLHHFVMNPLLCCPF